MRQYRAIELANIINAVFHKNDIQNVFIDEIVFDTRLPINKPSTAIFFALKGLQDGHLFIDDAYNKGIRNFCIKDKNILKI